MYIGLVYWLCGSAAVTALFSQPNARVVIHGRPQFWDNLTTQRGCMYNNSSVVSDNSKASAQLLDHEYNTCTCTLNSLHFYSYMYMYMYIPCICSLNQQKIVTTRT